MTPRLFIRRAAREEISEAFRWYQERSPELGAEFLDAVRAALSHVESTPQSFPIATGDIRKAPLRRFPYVVYYVLLERSVSILAVIHGRRHPRRWQSRR